MICRSLALLALDGTRSPAERAGVLVNPSPSISPNPSIDPTPGFNPSLGIDPKISALVTRENNFIACTPFVNVGRVSADVL